MAFKRNNNMAASFEVGNCVIEAQVSGPDLPEVQAIWTKLTAAIAEIKRTHRIEG